MLAALALEQEHVSAAVEHGDELQLDIGFAGVQLADERRLAVDLQILAAQQVVALEHLGDVLPRRCAFHMRVVRHGDESFHAAAGRLSAHPRPIRGQRPAGGELHHDAQPAVIEAAVPHQAAGRLVAVREAVHQGPKVAGRFRQLAFRQGAGVGHRLVEPQVVARMRREHAVVGDALARHLFGEHLMVLQRPHRVDDRVRVVAGVGHQLAADSVRLQFPLAPVARK